MVDDLKARLDECWEMGRKGRSPEGLVEAQHLLVQARQQQDAPCIAFALTCNAWFRLQLGYPDEGVDCAIEAKSIYADLGLDWGLSLSSAVYSWILLELGLSDLGFEEACVALEIAERTDDLALRAFAMTCKGMALLLSREDVLAISILTHALELAEKARDDCTIALNLINIGYSLGTQAETAGAQGNDDLRRRLLERAAKVTESALEFARNYGDLWNLRLALCNTAEDYAALGDFEAAERLLMEWRALGGQTGLREDIHYLYTSGEVLIRSGRLSEALEVCRRATDLASGGAHSDQKINTLRQLSSVEEALGDHRAALEHFRAHHDLFVVQLGEMTRRRALFAEMQLQTEQLRAEAMRLETEARQDVLTGLKNRRAFEAVFAGLGDTLFSLAILDLDHFKLVNDRYSHLVGDAVLARTGTLLLGRGDMQVFRLGGEEFALILPDIGVREASLLCEGICRTVENAHWGDLGTGLAVTASIGVADSIEFTGRALLEAADLRLYAAKAAGRNTVVSALAPVSSVVNF